MSNPRTMMLRKRKQFGRCNVQGHGSNYFCEVCDEIQTSEFTRSQEKCEVKKEINSQLSEMEDYINYEYEGKNPSRGIVRGYVWFP